MLAALDALWSKDAELFELQAQGSVFAAEHLRRLGISTAIVKDIGHEVDRALTLASKAVPQLNFGEEDRRSYNACGESARVLARFEHVVEAWGSVVEAGLVLQAPHLWMILRICAAWRGHFHPKLLPVVANWQRRAVQDLCPIFTAEAATQKVEALEPRVIQCRVAHVVRRVWTLMADDQGGKPQRKVRSDKGKKRDRPEPEPQPVPPNSPRYDLHEISPKHWETFPFVIVEVRRRRDHP